MSTANITAVFNGTLPFDINVTACNLLTDLSVKDFAVNNVTSNIAENTTLWDKVTPTLLRYSGGSVTMVTGSTIQIRRKTPNSVVQPVNYATRFSSDLWNKELDRLVRWREEAELNGVGTAGLVQLPVNDPYSIAWGNDTVAPPTRAAIFNYNNSIYRANFKNKFINGKFQVWQRGSTQAIPATAGTSLDQRAYLADKWTFTQFTQSGTSRGCTVSKQAHTPGQTAVPSGSKFYMRVDFTSAGAPSGSFSTKIIHSVEGTEQLAGKTVTLSLYARSSIPVKALGYRVLRNLGSGGSGTSDTGLNGAWVLNSNWQRYSVTFTMPSLAGQTIGVEGTDAYIVALYLNSSVSEVPSNVNFGIGTVDISDAQLEIGDAPTFIEDVPFVTDLLNCMRYYQQSSPYGVTPLQTTFGGRNVQYVSLGVGQWADTINFLIPFANTPTITINAADFTTGSITRAGVTVPATVTNIHRNGFFLFNNSGQNAATFFYGWSALIDYV